MNTRRTRTALLLLVLAPLATAVESSSDGPAAHRNWRVFCDQESRTAFRYPASIAPTAADARRFVPAGRLLWRSWAKRAGARHKQKDEAAVVEHWWLPRADAPAAVDDLASALAHLAGDAGRQPQRGTGLPGAETATWLRARVGDRHCFLVELPRGYAGLRCAAPLDQATIAALFDSFEVLTEHEGRWDTRRARACAAGRVEDREGQLSVARVTPPATDWQEPVIVESRFYRVYGTALPQDLLTMAEHLDAIGAGLQKLLPTAQPPRIKLDICLLRTAEQFAEVKADLARITRHQKTASSVQGFFSSATRTVFTFVERVRNSAGTAYNRASHEAVHQYLHVVGGFRPPQWLDEGLAVLFEPAVAKRGALRLGIPRLRQRLLATYYRQHDAPIIPIERYLSGQRFALHVHQYAEIASLVGSLLRHESGRRALAAYWQDRRREGTSASEGLRQRLLPCFAGENDKERRRDWQQQAIDLVTDSRERLAIGLDDE